MKISLYPPLSIHEIGQRSNQEDALAQWDNRLFVLCDGMGGHEKGEVASQTVCQSLVRWFEENVKDDSFTDDQFRSALEFAYSELDKFYNDSVKKMGTTLTLLYIHNKGITAAHMGDSRIYHIRPDKGILYQSRDHSLVFDLFQSGEITYDEMLNYPQKNIVTRAITPGEDNRMRPDIIHITDIQPNDYFYICSDGILESMKNQELVSILSTNRTDIGKKDILIDKTKDNQDNHSAWLIHIKDVVKENGDEALPNEELTARCNVVVSMPELAIEEEDVVIVNENEKSLFQRIRSIFNHFVLKKSLLILTMTLVPSLLMAQAAGGTIKRQTDNKQKTQQIKPKTKTNAAIPKDKSSTTKPAEDAVYNVKISCNAPSAVVIVDGQADGSLNEIHLLKMGSHYVTLKADGYEPMSQKIVVNSSATSFTFHLKKDLSALPLVIQRLIKNMVRIEGGTFTMGATPEQLEYPESVENTPHLVSLTTFSIGKYEVTQEEWETVMGNNPSRNKGKRCPVEYISWNDCNVFIHKLNELTGMNFRLPTEAEWEYAARGGKYSRGYKYAGSNNLNACAWYAENSGGKPHEVGQKLHNELGLYDMSGNVSEWCNDWYGSYGSSPITNPVGPSKSQSRVYRGGDFYQASTLCYDSYRKCQAPMSSGIYLGFRLAL